MKDNGVPLKNGKGLEVWLEKQTDTSFPKHYSDKCVMPYPERYNCFKKALSPIHNNVGKGAMAAGACEWMEKTKAIIRGTVDIDEKNRLLDQLIQNDPIVHLNNHGQEHVAKVIDKVSEMLRFFDRGHLTPYEGFLLLCAIQVHDVGNVFGRGEHEKRCKEILEKEGKPFIPDAIERRVIEKLASVHGGSINGERNTIDLLTSSKTLNDRRLRKTLLAALLRFGDELADDSSRADHDGLEQGTILEGSRIYHRYSQALHTVKIVRDSEFEKTQLHLSYEFDSDIANQVFKKYGENKYLLDEIYDRTLKMERERRYCMRFLRPYISLDEIRVEIVIQHAKNTFISDKIQYTLKENGYPSYPASKCIKEFMSNIRSGEEEKQYLRKEWCLS